MIQGVKHQLELVEVGADLAARYGGEEFVLLAEDGPVPANALEHSDAQLYRAKQLRLIVSAGSELASSLSTGPVSRVYPGGAPFPIQPDQARTARGSLVPEPRLR
jgi:hypothetical protein